MTIFFFSLQVMLSLSSLVLIHIIFLLLLSELSIFCGGAGGLKLITLFYLFFVNSFIVI